MTQTENPPRPSVQPPPLRGGSARNALVLLLTMSCVADAALLVLSPLVGDMTAALRLTSSQASWAVNATNLVAIVITGLAARYADIIGHKKVLAPLLALGVIGALLCALATSFPMLLAGRILAGAAVGTPMAWAIVRARADEPYTEKAAHFNGTAIAIMTPVSLILGGVLLSLKASWNSAFYLIAAGYLLNLILVLATRETPEENRNPVRLDWAGAGGLGAWLLCLLLAVSDGGTWGWSSGITVGLFAAAAVIMVAWIFQQRAARHPVMDFAGMDTRQVTAGYIIIGTVGIVAGGLFVLVPAFGQTPAAAGYGFGLSVLMSALPLLMNLPASLLAAPLSRWMLAKWGPRVPVTAGGLLIAAGYLFMAFAHTAVWEFYVGIAVYGTGLVLGYTVGWALCAAAARKNNMATIFGIQNNVTVLMSALVIAVCLAVMDGDVKALGPAFVPREGAYSGLFIGLAAVGLVGFALNGLFLVPRRLRHQSSAPVAPATAGRTDLST